MKALTYKQDNLRNRRRTNNRKLIWNSSTIDDLLLLRKNWIAVEEMLIRFNDLFNLLVDVHQEYNKLLDGDDEKTKDDD